VIRAAILLEEPSIPRSGPDSLPRPLADPLSRSPGHEEEHYGDPSTPSSQNDPFRRGLDHIAEIAPRWRPVGPGDSCREPRVLAPYRRSRRAQGAGRRAQGAGRRAMRPRRAAPCRRAVLPEPLKAISRPDPASPAPVHARGETAPHRPLPLREWTQSSGRLGPRQLRAPPEARGDRGARALSSVPAQCRAARELPASRVSRVGPAVRAPSPPAPSPVASTARDPSRIPYCCVHLLLRPPALRRRGSDRTLLALSPAMRGTPSTPRNCRRLPYFPTLSAFAAVRGEES
jgi:hypothetical protein